MSIYFVNHRNDDGEDMDLIVVADNPDDAVQLWWDYFDSWWGENGLEKGMPDMVYELPADLTTRRALPWHADEGMRHIHEAHMAASVAKLALNLV
jgi:hypothetical protein